MSETKPQHYREEHYWDSEGRHIRRLVPLNLYPSDGAEDATESCAEFSGHVALSFDIPMPERNPETGAFEVSHRNEKVPVSFDIPVPPEGSDLDRVRSAFELFDEAGAPYCDKVRNQIETTIAEQEKEIKTLIDQMTNPEK